MTASTAAFWQIPWLKPLNDVEAWNRVLQLANRTWSLTEVRARVLSVVRECADAVSLHLKPNGRFKGFVPGQYLSLTLPCNGVLKSRSFSLSKAPARDGSLRLTIRIKHDGSVSKAAAELKAGDVVTIGQAMGEFTLPEPERGVLLLSAGSGITPMMAMLQDWAGRGKRPDVVLVHSCRHASDWIFREELQTLVHRWPELRVHSRFSARDGRLHTDDLAALVPDYAERDTLLCGPEGFMADIADHYRAHGLSARLKQEHFQAFKTEIRPDAPEFRVFGADGQAAFTARNGQSLLEAAEQQGLNPAHGCRRGICMTCTCRKLGGTVHNQLTDTLSGDGDEWIQLCVSTPVSDLHLEMAP